MRMKLRSDSVCFGVEDYTQAGAYFRGQIPAKALGAWGWYTETANTALFPRPEDLKEYGPYIRGWNLNDKKLRRPCKIVTLRIQDDVVMDPETRRLAADYKMDSMAADITRAREAGQIVLYDVDDDIWHIPEWSPAARAMHKMAPNIRACDLDVVGANIRACDGVIVTTPYLKKIVETEFPDTAVWVLRPGIDPSVYRPTPIRPVLHVGWMGSMSHHLPHLRTMQIALGVLNRFNVRFLRIGYIDGDDSRRLLAEIPCPIRQHKWVDISLIPQVLSHVDIGIIPRVPTDFNEGQSVTSGLQYAAAGIPFLVSPSAEYERLERLGAGKVCRTINDWRQGLSDLLEFKDYRDTEAMRARECVEAEFGLEITGGRYAELFEELLNAES
jgi:glycosyltransferase involved in cell wall biosynthesis